VAVVVAVEVAVVVVVGVVVTVVVTVLTWQPVNLPSLYALVIMLIVAAASLQPFVSSSRPPKKHLMSSCSTTLVAVRGPRNASTAALSVPAPPLHVADEVSVIKLLPSLGVQPNVPA